MARDRFGVVRGSRLDFCECSGHFSTFSDPAFGGGDAGHQRVSSAARSSGTSMASSADVFCCETGPVVPGANSGEAEHDEQDARRRRYTKTP